MDNQSAELHLRIGVIEELAACLMASFPADSPAQKLWDHIRAYELAMAESQQTPIDLLAKIEGMRASLLQRVRKARHYQQALGT